MRGLKWCVPPPTFALVVGQAQRAVTTASWDPYARLGAAKEPAEQGLPRMRGTGAGHWVKGAGTSPRIWMNLSRDLRGNRHWLLLGHRGLPVPGNTNIRQALKTAGTSHLPFPVTCGCGLAKSPRNTSVGWGWEAASRGRGTQRGFGFLRLGHANLPRAFAPGRSHLLPGSGRTRAFWRTAWAPLPSPSLANTGPLLQEARVYCPRKEGTSKSGTTTPTTTTPPPPARKIYST